MHLSKFSWTIGYPRIFFFNSQNVLQWLKITRTCSNASTYRGFFIRVEGGGMQTIIYRINHSNLTTKFYLRVFKGWQSNDCSMFSKSFTRSAITQILKHSAIFFFRFVRKNICVERNIHRIVRYCPNNGRFYRMIWLPLPVCR